MRAIPLVSLLLGGWCVAPAYAGEAQDWLNRLSQAEQQQSFQGTFVYERNGSFSTHNIWHRVQDGKVRERLLQLDGSAQEVMRIDGHTQCVSGTLIAGLGNTPDGTARALDLLGRKYRKRRYPFSSFTFSYESADSLRLWRRRNVWCDGKRLRNINRA